MNWTFTTGVANERHFVTLSPAVVKKRVFFGGVDGTLHAIDRKTGTSLWRRELGSRISTAIVADESALVWGTDDGRLLRLRQKDGKTLASLVIEGVPFGRPLLLRDVVIALTTGGNILTVGAALGALEAERRNRVGDFSPDRAW